jgi:hypothetical protein
VSSSAGAVSSPGVQREGGGKPVSTATVSEPERREASAAAAAASLRVNSRGERRVE